MANLFHCHLYGILDLGYVTKSDVVNTTEALVHGGVDILQLRAKGLSKEDITAMAREILPITRAGQVPLIINDYPDIALEVGADGVHVGQDDDSVAAARAVVGDEFIVGKSTHSLAQARAAAEEPVDYIGFGPLFATPTKPDYQPIGMEDIATVHEDVKIPIFCIGGVKKENLPTILKHGGQRVAIVSGILQSPDIAAYIAHCRSILTP
ncbi:MAG: thiamine-phosphate pyrophosphorylase [Verrucomicrobiales bacterium]